MSDHDTPGARATIQVHEALIRQVIDGLRGALDRLEKIGNVLAAGNERFDALEHRQKECREMHDGHPDLSSDLKVLHEQVATLRLIVYGGVGLMLVGLMSTLGVVIVWSLRAMGKTP